MWSKTILFILLIFLKAAESTPVSYDVYLQLSQFRTSAQVIPYRTYELRWESECTTDGRQPTTKYPTAFSIDDSRLIFFDVMQQGQSPHPNTEQQNFVYMRQVPEMGVVCFRLYYRNELALEDCLVVDVRASDFADVRYSTKTRAHGNALTYQAQITPSDGAYQLLMQHDDNETLSVNGSVHRRLSPGCVAATTLASIEAFFILLATLGGLCWFFQKSGRISFGKLWKKRRSLGTGPVPKKIYGLKPKITLPQSRQPKIMIQPDNTTALRMAMSEHHYRAPSASSADSGLSTISNGSTNQSQTKKDPVVIYDDPPEIYCTRRSNDVKKKPSVHDYLTEMWKRTRPGNTPPPPPPPVPDYKEEDEIGPVQSISESLAYDVYAALEDPNNWDPPEQYWMSDHDLSLEQANVHPEHADPELNDRE